MTHKYRTGWVCKLNWPHSGPCPAYPRWWNLPAILKSKGWSRK